VDRVIFELMKLVHQIKKAILKTSPFRSRRLYKLMILSDLGVFFKNNKVKIHFDDRFELYEYISNFHIKNRPISYLEFGVYTGESLLKWISLNTNPNSVFYGFDSFEGLPENWLKVVNVIPKGYFSTNGAVPINLNDKRVFFIKGWFQNTLENFLKSFLDDKLKIIHFDADLYSSTLFCLTMLNSYIKRNDILVFDEFSSGDEFKAYMDYTCSYNASFNILAVSGSSFQQVAFIKT
jgi:O-methyltransferase